MRKIKKKREREKKNKKERNLRHNGKSVVSVMNRVINHYFPDLVERINNIEDYRHKSEYSIAELITACIAMFIFKEGSRNAFNNDREEAEFQKNYEKIFKMRLPHMDTVNNVMRRLKNDELEKLKTSMIRTLIEKRSLHKFRLFNKYFIVAVDGTGVHSFSEQHCEQCLTKTSKTGKGTFFHNVLEAKLICANGFSISLATEWIENPEGDFDKQDCERKAFKRLAAKLKNLYPRLPICIAADGLYPTKPFFDICSQNDWNYIVTFKEGNLPSVWEEVEVLKRLTNNNKCTHKFSIPNHQVTQEFCWINKIDYADHKINWIECIECSQQIKTNEVKTTRFIHLTNIEVTWRNALEISYSGRLRWKIENEGFNCQKNHGYNLQHKYSRTSYCAMKNYYQCLQIGHLLNQLVELSVNFLKLVTPKITIKHLWKCMMAFLIYGSVDADELSLLSKQRCQIRFG